MEKWRGEYRLLVGKPEVKRLLRRPRRKWDNNIKMDIQGMECIDLPRNRDRCRALVNAVMNFRVHKMQGNS
jgi:hypothetical protein